MIKPSYVTFGTKKLENSFDLLKSGKFQDKQLYRNIDKTIKEIKNNPMVGIKLPKNVWPKEYVKQYKITNLWKIDLPDGWRLIYTIQANDVMILSIILEWFSHKEYEKRFNY